MSWARDAWTTGLRAIDHADQDQLAPNETRTEGFLLVDANLTYRILDGEATWSLFARATNLLDEEGRRHTSYIKDLAPIAGRSLALGLQASF